MYMYTYFNIIYKLRDIRIIFNNLQFILYVGAELAATIFIFILFYYLSTKIAVL